MSRLWTPRQVAAPPTAEQLRVIADRAERGRLSPLEAARLRAGIDQLASGTEPRQPEGRNYSRYYRLARRLRDLHKPIMRGGIEVCAECSGWNGVRCVGLITEWPCLTLDQINPNHEQEER